MPAGDQATISDDKPYAVVWKDNAVVYEIDDHEYYRIGTRLAFLGYELIVVGIVTELVRSTIVHHYQLMHKRDIPSPGYERNQLLSGICLDGEVEGVHRDEVKVKFDIDEKKGYHWFVFASPYSSKQGGWYMMPDPGDRVRIFFPDNDERNSYANGMADREPVSFRENPKIRRLRHPNGNEIILAPTYLELCTTGRKSYIQLNSKTGDIIMKAQKSILIDSGDSLEISSGSKLTVSGGTAVAFRQDDNLVAISNDVVLRGENIRLLD